MPRWKVLPDEIDPQAREFTRQLRRLVDRSGLNLTAVADRTGYGKTSWQRYLNGQLPAPRGAIVALAEVTGTDMVQLVTMWELAEQAWSRSGPAAVRVSTEPREFGPPIAPSAPSAPITPTAPPGATTVTTAPVTAAPAPPSPSPRPPHAQRKLALFLAGVVGALLVIAAALLLTDLGGAASGEAKTVARTPSASPATSAPALPAGVKCGGAACTGKDPEAMGCGGEFAETVSRTYVGMALLELRYSKTCQAAWARVTLAAPGDTVQVSVGGKTAQSGLVNADNDAYTPMAAVTAPTEAKACVTRQMGAMGCTIE
ncbi:XRE family transcriptional regulator [Streptomyces sp. NPDC052236]|uniref:XRE family transcriptional regulator n=1 Tax=Streptomyces sp. NPDC052236 TaxID=3365686 RepID=UPI0037D0A945